MTNCPCFKDPCPPAALNNLSDNIKKTPFTADPQSQLQRVAEPHANPHRNFGNSFVEVKANAETTQYVAT